MIYLYRNIERTNTPPFNNANAKCIRKHPLLTVLLFYLQISVISSSYLFINSYFLISCDTLLLKNPPELNFYVNFKWKLLQCTLSVFLVAVTSCSSFTIVPVIVGVAIRSVPTLLTVFMFVVVKPFVRWELKIQLKLFSNLISSRFVERWWLVNSYKQISCLVSTLGENSKTDTSFICVLISSW